MASAKTLSISDLEHFTGTEQWYQHGINQAVLFTDGAKYLADMAGAHWLLDEIAIVQPYNKRIAREGFQIWRLAVHHDRSAALTCDDGNGNVVFTKQIGFTDFPIEEIILYFTDNVILLPSEY